MVIETEIETRESAALDAYIRRLTPPELQEGAPMPSNWTGSPEAWRQLAARFRRRLANRALIEFVEAIALRAYYPDELASGNLRPGSEIFKLSGVVKRPASADISADLAGACRRVLSEAARLQAPLDGVIAVTLEQAAVGRGVERDVRRKLEAAQAAVAGHKAQLDAQHREAAARPVLRVLHRFPGPGRHYEHLAPGAHTITPAQAEELRAWQRELEAQRDQRGWDAPEGYTPQSWPPFTIETPQT